MRTVDFQEYQATRHPGTVEGVPGMAIDAVKLSLLRRAVLCEFSLVDRWPTPEALGRIVGELAPWCVLVNEGGILALRHVVRPLDGVIKLEVAAELFGPVIGG